MDSAVLKIYGDIGEGDPQMELFFGVPDNMISSKSVSEFLDEHQDAKSITVRINSRGGDVQEGWAIHDLLVNSGKKIKTIGEGKIYSIATIIFLAGEEREIMKNADGIIHNPYMPEYSLADAYESKDLLKIAEMLKQEEEKILDYYVERTGAKRETLAEYMAEDTKLSAEDMVSLGFATKIVEPIKAYAYVKLKTDSKMDEKSFFEKLGGFLDKATEKISNFSRVGAKNITLTDTEGNELVLEKEEGVPEVGDKATPDGVFILENGDTITVSEGVITSIEQPETDTELEEANARIAELEQQLQNFQNERDELQNQVTEAVDLVNELRALKNSYKPAARGKGGNVNKVDGINLDRVKEIVNLKNNKE